MHELWWILIITGLFSLLTMVWTTICLVIHILTTLILSYWSAKVAARPILGEAVKIRKAINRALNNLGLDFKDPEKVKNGRKGGSVKQDPMGDFLGDQLRKIPFVGDYINNSPKSSRLNTIIEQEKARHGVRDAKADTPSQGVVP